MVPEDLNRIPDSVAPQVQLGSVPFCAQKTFQCGPAALAMVLQWSGIPVSPDDLKAEVYTPGRKGSFQSTLVASARRRDRLSYSIQGLGCLMRELDRGHPVIVLQNIGLSWLPRWHYGVVVGYDLLQNQIIMHTGDTMARRVKLATFNRTWKRAQQWGLLVLPSGAMPACAEEMSYLKAALGLQQAGHRESSLTAYRAAAGQWPDSARVQMALGNALYADSMLSEAIQAFRKAIAIDPENGSAYNNLAHVLSEMGALAQAEAMARQAIEIGGPHRALYHETLMEILRRRETDQK